MASKFDVAKHVLVPKHVKLSDREQKELFQRFEINPRDLPRINITDPAIEGLKVKEGDIIKIIRSSPTSGEAPYYRRVVKG